jgi:hypothetical protein
MQDEGSTASTSLPVKDLVGVTAAIVCSKRLGAGPKLSLARSHDAACNMHPLCDAAAARKI